MGKHGGSRPLEEGAPPEAKSEINHKVSGHSGIFFSNQKEEFLFLPFPLPKQEPYSDFCRFGSFLVNFSKKKLLFIFRFLIPAILAKTGSRVPIGMYFGKKIPVRYVNPPMFGG